MQWAFSLFIIGLSIVTFIQGILHWGTTLPEYSFLAIGLWESIVAIGVFSAIIMVASAFCLILISVYRFHLAESDLIQTSGSSQTPAIFAFTVRIHVYSRSVFLPLCTVHPGHRCQSWYHSSHLHVVRCGARPECFNLGEVSESCEVTEETSGRLLELLGVMLTKIDIQYSYRLVMTLSIFFLWLKGRL